MSSNIVVLLQHGEGRALVKQKCQEYGIQVSMFEELIDAEIDQQGKKRKAGLWDEFDRIFDEYMQEEVTDAS